MSQINSHRCLLSEMETRKITMPLFKTKTFQHLDFSVQVEQEFEALFEAHWQPIYQVMCRLTGCPDTAEDLTLETFMRLWKHPPRNNQNLGGWLYRVAVNLGYNALRAGKRRQQYENSAGHIALEQQSAIDPANEVERDENSRQVRAILRKMSTRDAKLLVLRYSDLSYKEIATALQVPASSIGKMLNRAEVKFENLYTRYEGRHAPEN